MTLGLLTSGGVKLPKYLWQVNYSPDGARGLLEQGGSARSAAINEMVESVGGRVESCYFAFGPDDRPKLRWTVLRCR